MIYFETIIYVVDHWNVWAKTLNVPIVKFCRSEGENVVLVGPLNELSSVKVVIPAFQTVYSNPVMTSNFFHLACCIAIGRENST